MRLLAETSQISPRIAHLMIFFPFVTFSSAHPLITKRSPPYTIAPTATSPRNHQIVVTQPSIFVLSPQATVISPAETTLTPEVKQLSRDQRTSPQKLQLAKTWSPKETKKIQRRRRRERSIFFIIFKELIKQPFLLQPKQVLQQQDLLRHIQKLSSLF